jgi:hypothetical protein
MKPYPARHRSNGRIITELRWAMRSATQSARSEADFKELYFKHNNDNWKYARTLNK